MSGFKRSSRFNRSGSSNSSEGRSSKASRSNSGYNRGKNESQGRSRKGEGKYNFHRLGSITISKSTSDDAYEFAMENLRGNEDLKLNVKVYLGKDIEEMALRNGDNLTLTFKVNDKDKDFVIGHLLTPINN